VKGASPDDCATEVHIVSNKISKFILFLKIVGQYIRMHLTVTTLNTKTFGYLFQHIGIIATPAPGEKILRLK
jgi:hypothetical protein